MASKKYRKRWVDYSGHTLEVKEGLSKQQVIDMMRMHFTELASCTVTEREQPVMDGEGKDAKPAIDSLTGEALVDLVYVFAKEGGKRSGRQSQLVVRLLKVKMYDLVSPRLMARLESLRFWKVGNRGMVALIDRIVGERDGVSRVKEELAKVRSSGQGFGETL